MKNKFLFLVFIVSLSFVFQVEVSLAATKEGTCAGYSTKIIGTCKPTGDCASGEKKDGTCPLESGNAYKYMDCCVKSSQNSADNASQNSAASAASSGDSTKFTNPLTFDTVEGFLTKIMGWIQGIIVTLSLVAIVIGALMYVTSFGAEKQITRAKETISAALIGLTLGVAAPSMLKELAGILGWTTSDSNVTKALSLSAIALKVLNFLLGIFGVLSLIMMVIGASLYLTSAGDEDRIKKGKDIFKYSVLGVLIAMSAMILVRQIAKFFVA